MSRPAHYRPRNHHIRFCVECRAGFATKSKRALTCGVACRQARSRRLREARASGTVPVPVVTNATATPPPDRGAEE
jgi:hypothetical protein